MEALTRPCVALILAVLASLRLGRCDFNCASDCFGPYENSEMVTSCEEVRTVLECYSANQQVCDSERGGFFDPIPIYLGMARYDNDRLGCEGNGTSENVTVSENVTTSDSGGIADTTTPLPNPILCPSVPEIYVETPVIEMSPADISPKLHPPECSMPRVSRLRQCSLFMDSQLRAFNSYRGGLETCSLPGSWFLLRHQSITIEVEGTNLEPGYNHTRLTKINVTFHTHDCNPIVRTYTAYNTEPLSSQFTPPRSDNITSPLQLILGEDGSVVTLMATWLNATVIIRRYAQFLSITLQVPREISLESEGLCTGCPSDLYVNITAINSLVPSTCPDDNDRAINNCYDHAGVVNKEPLIGVFNNSYFDACVFSMFKIKTSEVLTMFNAIASDAGLLVNVGTEPIPIPTFPTDDYKAVSSHPQPSTSESTDLSSTSDSSSSLPQAQSSPLTLIMMISIVSTMFSSLR